MRNTQLAAGDAPDTVGPGGNSGTMAMDLVQLWYATCCIGDLEAAWNAAPVPSALDQTTEMEQAVAVDGAGPLRTFFHVILPQAVPALTAVSIFHFFFAQRIFIQGIVITGVHK